jgi:DNA-binding Lrp family transcriptional regulator
MCVTDKLLGRGESLFLRRLIFWTEHSKEYGVFEGGRTWIYNTLDAWAKQLKISKSSVRRAVSSLKERGIIDSAYLSANRRDRTLFYAVNRDKLGSFLNSKKRRACVQKSDSGEHVKGHMAGQMAGQMYLTVTDTETNTKSNKSIKSEHVDLISQNADAAKAKAACPGSGQRSESERCPGDFFKTICSSSSATRDMKNATPLDPNTTRNMIRIWNEETGRNDCLTRPISRRLVEAFKQCFRRSLDEWRRYLKKIKTSEYFTCKFRVFLWEALSFRVIKRILQDGFGCGVDAQTNRESESELKERISQQKESEACRDFRRRVLHRQGAPWYRSWFGKVTLSERNGRIVIKAPSLFMTDWLKNHLGEEAEYVHA